MEQAAPRRRLFSSDFERNAWFALLFVAFALHVIKLGERPFHHDESIHAWSAHRLVKEGFYKYDPVYHGPMQYYAVATSFLVLGETDFSARFPAALGGVALVAMALLLRPRFGSATALASGALLALSPLTLYYTRFCREDVWSLLGTAGTFLFLDRFWREGRLKDIIFTALFAAVAFASKENFYVLGALMVPSILITWMEPKRGFDLWNRLRRIIDFLEKRDLALAGAFLLFFTVSELLYTVFLVHPESRNPVIEAISYWWGQHSIARVSGPWYYHLLRLVQYEFAIVIPGIVFAVRRWKTLSAVERFLFGWGILSLVMYAWLREKTPWLMVHQILPFVPLAGRFWADVFEKGVRWRAAGAVVAGGSVLSAVSLCFFLPAITPSSQRAESAVYVQTCPEMLGLVDQIRAFARLGEDPCAIVQGEAGWPLSWYLSGLPVNWEMPIPERRPPIVIADIGKADEVARILGPLYRREPDVPFRAWWVPEDSSGWKILPPGDGKKERKEFHPTVGELLTYVFTRKVWQGTLPEGTNPIGSLPVAVFRRGEMPRPPAPPPAAPPVAGTP